jgi:hypothetical protein
MKNKEVIPMEQIFQGLNEFYDLGFRMAINFLSAGLAEVIVAKSSQHYGEFVQAQQVETQMLAENMYAVLFVVANKAMDIYNEQAKEFDRSKKEHDMYKPSTIKVSQNRDMFNFNNPIPKI